jgi:hypothetical protein
VRNDVHSLAASSFRIQLKCRTLYQLAVLVVTTAATASANDLWQYPPSPSPSSIRKGRWIANSTAQRTGDPIGGSAAVELTTSGPSS